MRESDLPNRTGMRILKFAFLFFGLRSVIQIITGHDILPPFVAVHGELLYAIINSVFCAVAFYGIHKRVPITWHLGWPVIVAAFVIFLYSALSAVRKIPESEDPWVAAVAIVIIGAGVAFGLGFMWYRQKDYFAPATRQHLGRQLL